MRDRHANIQLQVCCTVNIFNVYYLEHVAKWIAEHSFDFVYWNIMHDAWYFSIATLPDSVKQVVAQHLISADIPAQFRVEIDRVVEFMNGGASTDGFMLRMKIRDLDRKRGQNMRVVAPEFATLIDYDFNAT
jgi:phage-related protein